MTNEEAVKMLRTMQRTVYLGNRKFEDAIECAIKALSEPLQPWEVLAAQAVLPQPKRGKWICTGEPDESWGMMYECSICGNHDYGGNYCSYCGAKMENSEDERPDRQTAGD